MNILFTSAGRRSYLIEYFKEIIGNDGQIHVANSTNITPAFLVADKTVITPLIYDSEYIPFLLKYCKTNNIDVIISLFDIDLPILSKNKEKFEKIGTRIIVSDYSTIDICNDKWKTFEFLKNNNIGTPKTYLSFLSAQNALDNKKIKFPLIIKPRWGMGSISIFEADTIEELKVFYNKVKRNIQKTYLKYESNIDVNKNVIIQEKMCGEEYSLDVINDLNGKYITTIVKKKIAMRAGETDCALTVNEEELINLGKKLGETLKHIGNLDVDVFKCDNCLYIIDMNARFGGGYPFSHIAGVNLPLAIIKWIKNEPVDKSILTPNYQILGQKDINIVQLPNS